MITTVQAITQGPTLASKASFWCTLLDDDIEHLVVRLQQDQTLRTRFIEFSHVYTAKIKDDEVVATELATPEDWQEGDDPTLRNSVYGLLTVTDEALGLFNYMNFEGVWALQYAHRDDPHHECHQRRKGVWTKRGAGKHKPGFSQEGIDCFKKAAQLFLAIRQDEDLKNKMIWESIQWRDANIKSRRRAAKRTTMEAGGGGAGNTNEPPPKAARLTGLFDDSVEVINFLGV